MSCGSASRRETRDGGGNFLRRTVGVYREVLRSYAAGSVERDTVRVLYCSCPGMKGSRRTVQLTGRVPSLCLYGRRLLARVCHNRRRVGTYRRLLVQSLDAVYNLV